MTKKKFTPAPAPDPLKPPAPVETPHSGLAATVQLRQGRYRGVVLPASSQYPREMEAWRGVPYAESTEGENRFRPPVPLPLAARRNQTTTTTFLADKFGPQCIDSEDCLKANIYRQADPRLRSGGGGRLLPVVVYVHGGAFNGGNGAERDLASFVSWSEQPMVAVNFNYRLGALGFLASTLAAKEGSLNLGLKDQQMLFEWVRQNIEAFGGDPADVTLMGLSAGAHSIGHHLLSYTSDDAPFHKAIIESGSSLARATWAPNYQLNEIQFQQFLNAVGIADDVPESDIYPLLRSLPREVIQQASQSVFGRYQDPIQWPFQPVVDGPYYSSTSKSNAVIPELPILKFRAGKQLQIPILTGYNTNEGTIFTNQRADTNEAFLRRFKTMIPHLTDSDVSALDTLYPDPVAYPETSPFVDVPQGIPGRQFLRFDAAYAHYAYICPVLQTAHFYSSPDAKSETTPPPVWVYQFDARREWGTANHGDEAHVVTHDMRELGPHPGLRKVADAMHGAWARFVATGDPNPPGCSCGGGSETEGTPYWPRFRSPFAGDTVGAPQLRRRRQGRAAGGGGGELGQVMLFGQGNDERFGAGRRNPGIPAQVVGLAEYALQQCDYWWPRIELSEGLGQRLLPVPTSRL